MLVSLHNLLELSHLHHSGGVHGNATVMAHTILPIVIVHASHAIHASVARKQIGLHASVARQKSTFHTPANRKNI